jgi:polyisoprenoid-binding protein YceI
MAGKAWAGVGIAVSLLVAQIAVTTGGSLDAAPRGPMQGASAPAQKPPDGQESATWQVDAVNSNVTFSLTHFMVSKAHGRFAKFTASLNMDQAALTASKIEVHIDAASIDTSNSARDDHLRTADFFDVQHFPEIVFTSTRIERAGDNRFRVVGNLTMHGVTREVVLDAEHRGWVKDPQGRERTAFIATTTLNRQDYGIKWNQVMDSGGVAIGDQVNIEIDLLAVKRAPAKPKV